MRFSIDLTIVGISIFIICLTYISAQIYLDIALRSQQRAVSQFISLESTALLEDLRQLSSKFSQSIQSDPEFRQHFIDKNVSELEQITNNHFNQYFITAGVLDVVEVRLLKSDYSLIANVSPARPTDLPASKSLCPRMLKTAIKRNRTDRLKPIFDLCNYSGKPYYSVLLPVGLMPTGYMEIVTNPAHALRPIESALGLSLSILGSTDQTLYESPNWNEINRDGYAITVDYLISQSNATPVLKIRARQRMKSFFTELNQIMYGILAVVGLLTILLFFVVRSIFSKLVINPINSLVAQLREPEKQSLINTGATVSHELAELGELYRALEHVAMTDRLTSLPNRHFFDCQMAKIVESTKQTDSTHVLMFCDLDQFKIVNDTSGHEAGDELLCQISTLIKGELRDQDIVARLGGDEFSIILIDCGLDEASIIANTIRKKILNHRIIWKGKVFSVGISIGMVEICKKNISVENLLRSADSSLYTAKDLGRNQVHIYHHNDIDVTKRRTQMQQVTDIRDALKTNRFSLMYQPIVDTRNTSGNAHCELLLRMQDHAGQLISPVNFIPAAERYEMMSSIDEWVVKTAFRTFMNKTTALSDFDIIAINLSGQSVQNILFIEFITEQFRITGMPAKNICFEITETSAITNIGQATKFIAAGKKLGCRFSLDDFGAGMSSFGYLKKLPVDYLKIDGSFIKNMTEDSVDREMVRHIHEIGRMMGIRTIAECVENAEIQAELEAIGVDYMQGWHLGYPAILENPSKPIASTKVA